MIVNVARMIRSKYNFKMSIMINNLHFRSLDSSSSPVKRMKSVDSDCEKSGQNGTVKSAPEDSDKHKIIESEKAETGRVKAFEL